MWKCILPLLISFSIVAQENAVINPDLERVLDGRSQIDKLTDEQLRQIAEDSIMLKGMGLDANIIRKAMELKKRERDALFSNTRAKLIKEIITISTDPSAPTPVIYATPGHETFVNVIDQTGEPWPIVIASSGNNLLFTTEAIEAHKYKNVFRLKSEERVGSSNITLLLQDKALSLTVRVENSKTKYHAQPILQITEVGPNGKQPIYISRNTNIRNDKVMKNLMFGLTPEGFKQLNSSSKSVQAWKGNDGQLYLKTKYNPINPAPNSSYSGPNGYSTYELDLWPVLVMTDDNGVEHQVSLDGE
ncbi:DotH/IcmK family type IV secretion protein [Pseudoalteromonas prydzensis]|uniref:DotH/IcmK family type IV secretion protein n=1 Tax=Pseudoalteromonas prydzensis TaxID=182141 RepID=UPI003FD5EC35